MMKSQRTDGAVIMGTGRQRLFGRISTRWQWSQTLVVSRLGKSKYPIRHYAYGGATRS